MKYRQPFGISDENAPYIDGNPALGIEGSAVPMEAVEHPQREIVNVIKEAGLDPDAKNLKQLALAIQALIIKAMPQLPDPYILCHFLYPSIHPTTPDNFYAPTGAVIANADTAHPKAWEYLLSTAGQSICKTLTQWNALSTTAGGVGGVPFYVIDTTARTIKLPDLRGDYDEQAGYEGLTIGTWGASQNKAHHHGLSGVNIYSTNSGSLAAQHGTGGSWGGNTALYSDGGTHAKPRRIGTNKLVYLGGK